MSSERRREARTDRVLHTRCVVLLLGTLTAVALTTPARADAPIDMQATPATCVALNKGQICFRRVQIAWSTLPADASYCLFQEQEAEPLTCWFGNTTRLYQHDYASASAERFTLQSMDDDETPLAEPLAEVQVSTAWVYRTNRRGASGWRLF